MSTPAPDTAADLLARVDPDNWTVTFRDGEPVLGVTVAGAADFVCSHVHSVITTEHVLGILAGLLPSEDYLDVAREVDRRRGVSADA